MLDLHNPLFSSYLFSLDNNYKNHLLEPPFFLNNCLQKNIYLTLSLKNSQALPFCHTSTLNYISYPQFILSASLPILGLLTNTSMNYAGSVVPNSNTHLLKQVKTISACPCRPVNADQHVSILQGFFTHRVLKTVKIITM